MMGLVSRDLAPSARDAFIVTGLVRPWLLKPALGLSFGVRPPGGAPVVLGKPLPLRLSSRRLSLFAADGGARL
jgi:hypothetical protein